MLAKVTSDTFSLGNGVLARGTIFRVQPGTALGIIEAAKRGQVSVHHESEVQEPVTELPAPKPPNQDLLRLQARAETLEEILEPGIQKRLAAWEADRVKKIADDDAAAAVLFLELKQAEAEAARVRAAELRAQADISEQVAARIADAAKASGTGK